MHTLSGTSPVALLHSALAERGIRVPMHGRTNDVLIALNGEGNRGRKFSAPTRWFERFQKDQRSKVVFYWENGVQRFEYV